MIRIPTLRGRRGWLILVMGMAMAVASAGADAAPRPEAPVVPPTPAGAVEPGFFVEARARAQALARERHMARTATANQAAYDQRYASLDLDLAPSTSTLTASVRLVVVVTSGPLTSLDLDFHSTGLTVDGATCAGSPAASSQANDVLTLQLDRAYAQGETIDVSVQYHGTPESGGFGYFTFKTINGLPLVASLSEPYGAHYWWPCKDQPSDKLDSVDVRVTAPTGMKTASNGSLVSSSDDGSHSVWQWHERHPIAPYLVSVASYPYDVHTDWYHPTAADSMPITFFVFPPDVAGSNAVNAEVKDMIAWDAAHYGAYPFVDEKYGHAEFAFGGGMEHQTCTSVGSFGEYLVAHELGHQWWGDKVTCRSFHHVWLNEGFATYTEALWAEAKGGIASYHSYMNNFPYYGAGSVYRADTTSNGSIFNGSLSYGKGAWTLHMLRHVLGDATFFAGMQAYGNAYAYSTAVTEDFQAVLESVSGRSLQKFFQEWIYGEYYPAYRVTYTTTPAGGGYDVTVGVTQTQTNQTFWMPIDVTVSTASSADTYVVGDSLAYQTFTFHTTAPPTAVQLDKDDWILKTVEYPTGVEGPSFASAVEMSAPSPNPTVAGTSVSFSLPQAAEARVTVLDASGRRVRDLARGWQAAGLHHLQWSGRDAHGALVPAGLYWVALESGSVQRVRRLAVIR